MFYTIENYPSGTFYWAKRTNFENNKFLENEFFQPVDAEWVWNNLRRIEGINAGERFHYIVYWGIENGRAYPCALNNLYYFQPS